MDEKWSWFLVLIKQSLLLEIITLSSRSKEAKLGKLFLG